MPARKGGGEKYEEYRILFESGTIFLLSAGDRFGAEQVAQLNAEETGYIREEFFFRNLIAVLPVGDGSVHEVEDLVTAGPGNAFLFSEDPEFCSE